MAKIKNDRRNGEIFQFPLDKTNFLILGLGVIVLIVGFVLMGMADHPDDFISLTLSPVLLVISFCVIFPIGIMYRSNSSDNKGA